MVVFQVLQTLETDQPLEIFQGYRFLPGFHFVSVFRLWNYGENMANLNIVKDKVIWINPRFDPWVNRSVVVSSRPFLKTKTNSISTYIYNKRDWEYIILYVIWINTHCFTAYKMFQLEFGWCESVFLLAHRDNHDPGVGVTSQGRNFNLLNH
jgi:hypothetical protein